jgi:hypothetical protein
MDSNPNPQPVDNHVPRNSLTPHWTAAKERATVLVSRPGRDLLATLIYWPGDRPHRGSTKSKARVQLASGKYISVNPSAVTLIPTPPLRHDEIQGGTKGADKTEGETAK